MIRPMISCGLRKIQTKCKDVEFPLSNAAAFLLTYVYKSVQLNVKVPGDVVINICIVYSYEMKMNFI